MKANLILAIETYCFLCGLVGLFVLAYIVKSKMGIDIFLGNSHPFPEFLKEIGVCH